MQQNNLPITKLEIITMQPRIRRRRSKLLLPYVEHWHTADILQMKAEEHPGGAFHLRLSCVMFRYFAFESFLNLIGEEQFVCWRDLERLPTEKKLNLLSEKMGIPVDYGQMPWQMVRELANVRNQIAHGKNEPLNEEDVVGPEAHDREMFESVKANWQKFPTTKKCTQVKRQIEEAIITLWTASGHELHTLFSEGIQFGSSARQ